MADCEGEKEEDDSQSDTQQSAFAITALLQKQVKGSVKKQERDPEDDPFDRLAFFKDIGLKIIRQWKNICDKAQDKRRQHDDDTGNKEERNGSVRDCRPFLGFRGWGIRTVSGVAWGSVQIAGLGKPALGRSRLGISHVENPGAAFGAENATLDNCSAACRAEPSFRVQAYRRHSFNAPFTKLKEDLRRVGSDHWLFRQPAFPPVHLDAA